MDYQTTLKYLNELTYLGLITSTHHGYIVTSGGSQLIFPYDQYDKKSSNDQNFPDQNSDILININPTTQFQSNSNSNTTQHKNLITTQESQSTTQTNTQTNPLSNNQPDEHYLANMECLNHYGISKSKASITIAQDPTITPHYIDLQAKRLIKEDRFTTGLLITVLRCHDPLPYSPDDEEEEEKPNKYTSGKYADCFV